MSGSKGGGISKFYVGSTGQMTSVYEGISIPSVFNMEYVFKDSLLIDFQVNYVSRTPKRVFIKELAGFDLEKWAIRLFLMKTPVGLDPSIRYSPENTQMMKIHGVHWDHGEYDYDEGIRELVKFCKPYTYIYTRGLKRKFLLQNLLSRVVYDLTELFCPETRILVCYYLAMRYDVCCPYHQREITLTDSLNYFPSCSYRNAYLAGLWMIQRGVKADFSEPEGRFAVFSGSTSIIIHDKLIFAVLGFTTGHNCQSRKREIYCTNCGFVVLASEDIFDIFRQHRRTSLLCHLKNYEYYTYEVL